jgi:dolichyl-phosphate-mannose--protein O-mannosyl transferase
MVPIIYNFSKKFFKETWISIITTILFTFDFMHFVQTRISTIDVFVTLFIMLSYYFMYCYTRLSFFDTKLSKTLIPLGLCGLAMGLSWASKWTGIYSSAGLAIIFFVQMGQRFREYIYATKHPEGESEGISHADVIAGFHKKLVITLLSCCVFFIVVPACIYLLSYIPFQDGTNRTFLQKVIEAQKTMFNYHTSLDATHPYSSKWYQWPIMYRPIWYYSGVVSDTVREGISAFGNPLVWWAGIPAFAFMLYRILFKRDRKAAFLSVGYLSQYAPWFMVTRVVFIYHYFPSVPFITVMVGYSMYLIVKRFPKAKKWMFVYAALAVGLFLLFYPVLSGTPTTIHYAETYLKWFDSWVLLQTW